MFRWLMNVFHRTPKVATTYTVPFPSPDEVDEMDGDTYERWMHVPGFTKYVDSLPRPKSIFTGMNLTWVEDDVWVSSPKGQE